MIPGLIDHNRNIAIYDTLLFNSTSDDYVIALDATTDRWLGRPRSSITG